MVPFESLGTVSYSPSIVTMPVSLAVSEIFSVKEWRHSMSLKLVPFESLDAVSYSPSIVTVAVSVAVCETFTVKEWRDLENQVKVIENCAVR